MNFIKNFFITVSALTLVDFIFFISMILLIILVVALIYFIKINSDDEIIEASNFEVSDEVKEDATNLCKGAYDDERNAIIDLQSITKELENRKSSPIDLTEYEQEQEQRAIISYDELVNRQKSLALNYEPEEINDSELSVKKVDLENLVNIASTDTKSNVEVRVISYQKEEDFLKALKKLQEMIN